jgi:hypothetical protein
VQIPGRPSHITILFLIAVVAVVAYLPTLTQPFIEDDYPNILLAREYGPVSGWHLMAEDSIQRVRATTFVLSYEIEQAFGSNPVAFYSFGIFLHILNCWLLFGLGRWRLIGFRTSAWAAAFSPFMKDIRKQLCGIRLVTSCSCFSLDS